MTTHTREVLPPLPTTGPIIVRAPEDADRQCWAAAERLRSKVTELVDKLGRREWDEALAIQQQLPMLEATLERAREVVSHGDLDVDRLVADYLERSQGDWVPGPYGIDGGREFGGWDWRLRHDSYTTEGLAGYERYGRMSVSPVVAVVLRLLVRGEIIEHKGRNAIRLRRASDK